MIGRAAIGNPWIFNQIKKYLNEDEEIERAIIDERINILKHLYFQQSGKEKN